MLKFRFVLSLMSLVLITSPAANADSSAAAATQEAEFNEARALLRAGREDIIRDEIRFSEEEAADFWPAYEAYREEINAVRDRQAEAVVSYLVAYRDGAVTSEQASILVDVALAIKGDLVQVQRKYLDQFRAALPAWKVARFYQLENKLDAELDVLLARFIPLMDPT